MSDIVVLIPAYNPDKKLLQLISELSKCDFYKIVVVNDGSSQSNQTIFTTLQKDNNVVLLEHAVRLGKGAALKTGFNYIYTHYSNVVGIVTADADGQHKSDDILKIANILVNHPTCLIIGARKFGKDVPWRSKIGNKLTIKLFKLISGQKISDTQSGLRGIPLNFIPKLLNIKSDGYEFELEMLLMCKYEHIHILERKITTVYIDKNKSSHFNPIIDSLKIYFELFRSLILSILTALLDNIVFIICIKYGFAILTSQVLARICAVIFNYPLAKKWVFYSNMTNKAIFPRYILLVIISGGISYGVIHYLVYMLFANVFLAKIIAETIIYLGNFAVQRDFIFTRKTKYIK